VLLQPLTKAMLQVSTVLIFYYGLLPVATAAIGLIFLVLVRVFYIKKADV
jgi:type II secretory pathway component PulF